MTSTQPVFDVGDTVRVSEFVALAAAGHTGIVAEVDPATTDDDAITYHVTLDGPNPPAYPGGWWLDELHLFPHDRDWEDDGA